MTDGIDRRRFVEMAMCGALAACGGDSANDEPAPPPRGQIDKAIAELDKLAHDLMAQTGVPGMAVAVVPGDRKVYATRRLTEFTGTYANAYYGPAPITRESGALMVSLGPEPQRHPLEHWDSDVFAFTLWNENANPGTISKATFTGNQVTLEYYDHDHLGTFVQ